MTLDMFVVTVVLVMVLLFFILLALLSRIWEDKSPQIRAAETKCSQADEVAAVDMERAVSRKESLAS